MGGIFGGGARGGRRIVKEPRAQSFEIEGEKEARERAGEQFERSEERSRQAQQQRQSLISQLQEQAAGRGPSLAEAQLRSAQERTLGQQLAAAAAQRGGSVAAQQRQLARSQAEAGQALGQQAAQARIQEAAIARQELGQQIAGEQQLADQLTQNFLQQGFSFAQAQQQARAQLERLRLQRGLGLVGAEEEAKQRQGEFLGAGLSGIGSAISFLSDKTQKENIKSASKDTKAFLDNLKSYSYNYKNTKLPGTSDGKRFGIMAQDLEKSRMGKSFVKETPIGKMIDVKQGFGAVLAAQANLNERIKQIEKKSKKD